MIRTVFIILLFSISTEALCQKALTEKYWDYRDRLSEKFLVVGDAKGKSSPAAFRNEQNSTLKWADNGIYLGWYIATLASEYQVLNSGDFDGYELNEPNRIQQNLDELYFALKCLERLDVTAENAFKDTCGQHTNLQNGFFIRDDVEKNFHHHFPGITTAISDYTAVDPFDKEMSQDQAYHILIGLALINRYVPYGTIVNNTDIRSLAVKEALLILNWIHQDWNIKNPSCLNSGGEPKSVKRGADTFSYGVGISRMMQHFSNDEFDFEDDLNFASKSVWNTFKNPANPAFSNNDNLHMLMAIVSICAGFDEKSFDILNELSIRNNWPVYPLLFEAIHGTNGTYDNYFKRKDLLNNCALLLNSAESQGTYSPWPGQNSTGWGADNRFLRDVETQINGKANTEDRLYNGLDFMLLHNLYWIANEGRWVNPLQGEFSTKNLDFNLFPNPAINRIVFVKLNKDVNSEVQIDLHDMFGRSVLKKIFIFKGDTFPLLLPQLSAGNYTVSVRFGEQIYTEILNVSESSF